jgi:glycosyltransferase involved in cell wall biosynthesis
MVSLVMCAWRPHPNWLREAVASALDQDGCDVELVLVDDGSPEPVASLLTDVTDPRLRVVSVEHGGLSRARNVGVAAARGTAMRFIDADDVITPGSTAALLAALSDSVGVSYAATMDCDVSLHPVRTHHSTLDGDVTVPCLLGQFDVMMQSVLFDRRVVEAAGPFNPALEPCEDYDFVLRAVARTRVDRVDHVATLYRRHEASITRTADLATAEVAWRGVVDGFFERNPQLRGSVLQRRAEAVVLLDRARAYAYRGQTREALDRLIRASRRTPADAIRAIPALLELRYAAARRVRGAPR